ncbi:MAG: hypothetical protein QOF45_795 [Gaiellaceae bacterium]|nr:hypothetical protein [Gaiellaceae bacterium]
MPAEAIRFQRRLGARDRWLIALLVGGMVLATVITLIVGRVGDDSTTTGSGAGCVSVSRASWMGNATLRYCGDEAVAYCRKTGIGQFAAGHPESVAACRKAGLLPTP